MGIECSWKPSCAAQHLLTQLAEAEAEAKTRRCYPAKQIIIFELMDLLEDDLVVGRRQVGAGGHQVQAAARVVGLVHILHQQRHLLHLCGPSGVPFSTMRTQQLAPRQLIFLASSTPCSSDGSCCTCVGAGSGKPSSGQDAKDVPHVARWHAESWPSMHLRPTHRNATLAWRKPVSNQGVASHAVVRPSVQPMQTRPPLAHGCSGVAPAKPSGAVETLTSSNRSTASGSALCAMWKGTIWWISVSRSSVGASDSSRSCHSDPISPAICLAQSRKQGLITKCFKASGGSCLLACGAREWPRHNRAAACVMFKPLQVMRDKTFQHAIGHVPQPRWQDVSSPDVLVTPGADLVGAAR